MKDFPASSMVKNLPSNAGDASLLPGQGTWEPTYLSTAAKRGPDNEDPVQWKQNKQKIPQRVEWLGKYRRGRSGLGKLSGHNVFKRF